MPADFIFLNQSSFLAVVLCLVELLIDPLHHVSLDSLAFVNYLGGKNWAMALCALDANDDNDIVRLMRRARELDSIAEQVKQC